MVVTADHNNRRAFAAYILVLLRTQQLLSVSGEPQDVLQSQEVNVRHDKRVLKILSSQRPQLAMCRQACSPSRVHIECEHLGAQQR